MQIFESIMYAYASFAFIQAVNQIQETEVESALVKYIAMAWMIICASFFMVKLLETAGLLS